MGLKANRFWYMLIRIKCGWDGAFGKRRAFVVADGISYDNIILKTDKGHARGKIHLPRTVEQHSGT